MGCRQCLSVSFFSRATLTIIGGAAAIRLEWTSFFFLKREVLCHSNRFLNEWDLIEELNFNWKPLWLCVYRLPSNRVLCAYVTVKFQCCTWKSSGDVLPRLSIRPKNEESCRNGKGQRGRASPSFFPLRLSLCMFLSIHCTCQVEYRCIINDPTVLSFTYPSICSLQWSCRPQRTRVKLGFPSAVKQKESCAARQGSRPHLLLRTLAVLLW